MSTSDRAAELRRQAESLDTIAELEDAAAAAKANYRENRDDEGAKAEHRAAAQALADAREDLRGSAVAVATGDGSTTVVPASIKKAKG